MKIARKLLMKTIKHEIHKIKNRASNFHIKKDLNYKNMIII